MVLFVLLGLQLILFLILWFLLFLHISQLFSLYPFLFLSLLLFLLHPQSLLLLQLLHLPEPLLRSPIQPLHPPPHPLLLPILHQPEHPRVLPRKRLKNIKQSLFNFILLILDPYIELLRTLNHYSMLPSNSYNIVLALRRFFQRLVR